MHHAAFLGKLGLGHASLLAEFLDALTDALVDIILDDADQPAWSLTALLEVMPKELEVGLFKTPISGEYFFSWWTDDHHMGDDYKEPIDAAFEMVCWLLGQGLIKKGGKNE